MKKISIKTKIYSLLTLLALIIPILTFLNIQIPKNAWAADVIKVQKEYLSIAIDLYERELHMKKYERRKLSREMQEIEMAGKNVTDQHILDELHLDNDIQKIESFLEDSKKLILNEN